MPRLLLRSALLLASFGVASAQSVIFDDDFSTAPAANGWTTATSTTNTGVGIVDHTGSAAVVDKTAGAGDLTGTLTRTISTLGFENIELQLTAFQSGTNFEGGAVGNNNTDDISLFINTGSGFAPLFQRTGVWGATGLGFTDGGTGPGNETSTPSGFLLLGGAAANNANLQIRLSATISAQPEDQFFDQFTLQGDPIIVPIAPPAGSSAPPSLLSVTPLVTSESTPEPILLIEDISAMASVFDSGLATTAVLPEATLTAARTATRDINIRLFRLRSGLGIGEFDAPDRRSRRGGSSVTETPVEMVSPTDSISGFELYAAGDFGQTEQDPISELSSFEGETFSSTVGAEIDAFDQFALGVGWTYLENDTKFSGGDLANADLTGHAISAYGSWAAPDSGLYGTAMYSYAQIDNELTRITGLGHDARSDSHSDTHLIDAEVGYQFRLESDPSIMTGPIAGIDWVSGEIGSFSETGRIDRGLLDVEDIEYESLVSRLGWVISKQISCGEATLVPQLRAAWEHEFEGSDETTRVGLQQSPFSFVQGNRFLREGGDFSGELSQSRPGRDYLSAGAGLQVQFDQWSVGFDYEGVFFRTNQSSHFASVRVSVEF